ncbi:MAG: hypothetical protein ACK551_06200 [Vampirovibrionales bacterium]
MRLSPLATHRFLAPPSKTPAARTGHVYNNGEIAVSSEAIQAVLEEIQKAFAHGSEEGKNLIQRVIAAATDSAFMEKFHVWYHGNEAVTLENGQDIQAPTLKLAEDYAGSTYIMWVNNGSPFNVLEHLTRWKESFGKALPKAIWQNLPITGTMREVPLQGVGEAFDDVGSRGAAFRYIS